MVQALITRRGIGAGGDVPPDPPVPPIGKGYFVIVNNTITGQIFYTKEITQDISTNLPYKSVTGILNSVVYGGGFYVAVGEGANNVGIIYYTESPEEDWTQVTSVASPEKFKKVLYINNQFIALADNKNSFYANNPSKDWKNINFGEKTGYINNIAYDGKSYIAVGSRGYAYYANNLSDTWASNKALDSSTSGLNDIIFA